ncbi:hypothetical protein FY034_14380 [Trichlorobacter lovleyi]|uniref:hypothetical protein n=1 Tax=Trichlorobacter lovleyi TaxID=313985 RepID=UPI00223F1319|nr:hypothetical protein [Trichlorobacter lovleyi]QOX80070.1 hypothetical protein FY034_14380 [Trichlorobacter lovleyi]
MARTVGFVLRGILMEWLRALLQCSVVAMQRLLLCQSGWPVAGRGGMLLLHLQRHPGRTSGLHSGELCTAKIMQYPVIVFVFKNICWAAVSWHVPCNSKNKSNASGRFPVHTLHTV